MNIESFREYCLSMPHVTEKMPFGPDILVFCIGGKMFALANINDFRFINVKCDPEKAQELRADFEEVKPAYHMNKTHWNSIYLDGRLKNSEIQKWIKDSYYLIYQGLPKKIKQELNVLIQ